MEVSLQDGALLNQRVRSFCALAVVAERTVTRRVRARGMQRLSLPRGTSGKATAGVAHLMWVKPEVRGRSGNLSTLCIRAYEMLSTMQEELLRIVSSLGVGSPIPCYPVGVAATTSIGRPSEPAPCSLG